MRRIACRSVGALYTRLPCGAQASCVTSALLHKSFIDGVGLHRMRLEKYINTPRHSKRKKQDKHTQKKVGQDGKKDAIARRICCQAVLKITRGSFFLFLPSNNRSSVLSLFLCLRRPSSRTLLIRVTVLFHTLRCESLKA